MGKFYDFIKRKMNPKQAAIDDFAKANGLQPGAKVSTAEDMMKRHGGNAYFIRSVEKPHRYMHWLGETKDDVAYGLQGKMEGACIWDLERAYAFVKEFESQPVHTDIEIIRVDQVINAKS
jgi:hypothetical protein